MTLLWSFAPHLAAQIQKAQNANTLHTRRAFVINVRVYLLRWSEPFYLFR